MYGATSAHAAAAAMQQGQHHNQGYWPGAYAAVLAGGGPPEQSRPAVVAPEGWALPAHDWSWYGSYPSPQMMYTPHMLYGSGPHAVPFVSGDPLKVPIGFDVAGAAAPTQEAWAYGGWQEDVVDPRAEAAPLRPSRQPEHVQELVRQFGGTVEVGGMKGKCERYVANLDSIKSPDKARRDRAERVMDWATGCPGHLEDLSFAKEGCRVIQKALDVGGTEAREVMAETLIPLAARLLDCRHGNHVLAKVIEVLPPTKLGGVIEVIQGRTAAVSRTRFGCRVLERLIEHCNGAQVGGLLDEVIEDVEALARHQFGNFVVQHLFEHGDAARKTRACAILLAHVAEHAKHRTASHVVQRILEHTDAQHQRLFVAGLLEKPAFERDHSLEAVMASRYGSFVVRQLLEKEHPLKQEVEERVRAASGHLGESNFALRNIVEPLAKSQPDFFSGSVATGPCGCGICKATREMGGAQESARGGASAASPWRRGPRRL